MLNGQKKWDLTLNPNKTKAMAFSNKRNLNPLPEIKINETVIEWAKNFKYLGLTLDAPLLTWNEHIKNLKRDAAQRTNVMRALAGSTWGADRDLLTTLYKTYIRSKLTYGVAAVASTSNTYMNTLERIQNTAIRIIIDNSGYLTTNPKQLKAAK